MPLPKACSRCGVEFPSTAAFWYPDYSSNREKLQNECRLCTRKRVAAWRQAHPREVTLYRERAIAKLDAERNGESFARLLQPIPTEQTCSSCHETFPLTPEFWHKSRARRCGLANPCKRCTRKRADDWYAVHRGEEVIRERNRKYYQTNREAVKDRTSRARAQRKLAPGRVTQFDIGVQFGKQNGLCFYCQKSIEGRNFDVDHYVPLCKGGTNTPKNIVLACPTCNNSKHAKLPAEFKPR